MPKKISQLPDGGQAQDGDLFLISRGNASYKLLKEMILPAAICVTVGLENADHIADPDQLDIAWQAAMDEVKNTTWGKGLVYVKAGDYETAQVELPIGVSLQAESRGTHIKGKTNEAPCIIKSEDFDTVAGFGNAFAGVAHFFIDGFTFEGGAQIASGESDYREMNAVIKIYGWDYRLSNIRIDYAPEISLYTEHDNDWNDDGTFNTYEFGENVYKNVRIKNYNKVGWVNRGSHDSYIDAVYISSSDSAFVNPDYGYIQETDGDPGRKFGSNGSSLNYLHVWGNHNWNAVLLDNSNVINGFIYAEGSDGAAIYIRGSSANKFNAFVGYCTHGIEFQGASNGNEIAAVVESNVSGALFKLNDAASNNILKQSPGYGTPGTFVFDLDASYTGSKNTFIPWNASSALFTGAPHINDFINGDSVTAPYKRVHTRMKNTSGGTLNLGDVVILKAVAAGDEVTTTTTGGDNKVYGMVSETIANNAYGLIFQLGKTVSLKVDGTTDIAVGDYLSTFTTAKISKKAGAGETVFAMALEAYTANDSNGVIDALLIPPRLI